MTFPFSTSSRSCQAWKLPCLPTSCLVAYKAPIGYFHISLSAAAALALFHVSHPQECSFHFSGISLHCPWSSLLSSSIWCPYQHNVAVIFSYLGIVHVWWTSMFMSLLSALMPVFSSNSFVVTVLCLATLFSICALGTYCVTHQWCDHLPCSSPVPHLPLAYHPHLHSMQVPCPQRWLLQGWWGTAGDVKIVSLSSSFDLPPSESVRGAIWWNLKCFCIRFGNNNKWHLPTSVGVGLGFVLFPIANVSR